MVWKTLLIGLLVWAAALGTTEVFGGDEAPSKGATEGSQHTVRARPQKRAGRRAVSPPRARVAANAGRERYVDERELQPEVTPEPEAYFTEGAVPEVPADAPSFEGGMGLRDSVDGAPLDEDVLVFPDDGAGVE